MKALGEAGVPVPMLLSLCEDPRYENEAVTVLTTLSVLYSVIGTPFYLMKYIPGRVLKDPSLPSLEPTERRV